MNFLLLVKYRKMKFPRELIIEILKIKSWTARKNNLEKKLKFPTKENLYTIPYYKWYFNESKYETATYYSQSLYLPKHEYVIYANKRYYDINLPRWNLWEYV